MTEDKRLAALWKIANHIPENWGDKCKNGYVSLNISADAIEAVEAAILPMETVSIYADRMDKLRKVASAPWISKEAKSCARMVREAIEEKY